MSDDYSTRVRQVFTGAANEMGRPLDPVERRLIATFARTDELIARVQARPWWAFWVKPERPPHEGEGRSGESKPRA